MRALVLVDGEHYPDVVVETLEFEKYTARIETELTGRQ